MDIEVAEWLAEMIQQSVSEIQHGAGLTIEVDDHPENWLQIVPEAVKDGVLTGFVVNFPYRSLHEDPLERLAAAGIKPPPSTKVATWEGGGYATLRLRADVPLVAFALFVADVLERIGGAHQPYEINLQIMHGL
jgi:hypothetical protein